MVDSDFLAQRLECAIQGDEDALERLLLSHATPLARYVAPRIPLSLQSQVSVEDVVQDTCFCVFRDIGKFKPQSDASFFAWLKKIADARLNDAIRRRLRAKRAGDHKRLRQANGSAESSFVDALYALTGHDPTASKLFARDEGIAALKAAMATLPEDDRRAVVMRYFEFRSIEEVAEALGRTEAAVRGLLHRSKQKLGERMGSSSRFFSHRQ